MANPKVAWKLQASNAAKYSVRPWSGTLASGDEVSVGITVKGALTFHALILRHLYKQRGNISRRPDINRA